MMKNRVCIMLIAALVFSVFAVLPMPAYAPVAHTDTYKSDTTDLWWFGANSGHIDGSGYIVPPSDAVWSSAVLCWVHPSWNPNLYPADRKAKLFEAPSANWIWKSYQVTTGESYTGDIVLFKKQINIPTDAYNVQADLLIMTADNAYYFYVNDDWSGTPAGIANFAVGYNPTNFYYVADGTDKSGGTNSVPYETIGNLYPKDAAIPSIVDYWASIESWSITSLLSTGENWLQIVAINEHAPPSGSTNNPAGLIYKLIISYQTPIYYYLTVQTDPSGLTPAPTPPSGWFGECTNVAVTAYAVAGYVFVYWDVDGISQGIGVNPITIHMNAAHTATAHYWPELECETFVTDSNFYVINGFDTVWTPKDMRKTTFKLASTNPGQFMLNIKVHNTWPVPIDTLTITYALDLVCFSPDFILKGADPIQVHTGYGKTGTRIDATVTYGLTGTITITNIAHCTTLYITFHLEYDPARDYFDKATMLDWKTLHEPNVFMCDYTATVGAVTGTGSCSTTLPDPLIILAIEEE